MSEYIYVTDEREGHWLTGEEIVRCRDCKHMYEVTMPSMLFADETFTSYRCDADQWSTASLMPMHSVVPDGFCAWAERGDA